MKKLKKFMLCGVFLATMVFMSFLKTSVTAFAEEGLTKISCGEGVYYTLSSDGVVTISGDGTMTDYYNDWFAPDPGWAANRSDIKKIVIEEGVTEIKGAAFGFMWTYPNVKEIEIASTVSNLGPYAFGGCTGLEKITLKGNAPTLENKALPNKELTVVCQAGTIGIDSGDWQNDNVTIEGILSVSATVSAQAEGAYLLPITELTVESNLAEYYGYEDKVTDSASVLDFLVAVTKELFGDDYTPDNKLDYLEISSEGYITKIFGQEGSAEFRVDQELVIFSVNETAVYKGYDVQFYTYTDKIYYTDKYTYLSIEGEVKSGKSVEVYAKYEGFDSNWNTVLVPLQGASIGILDMDTGLVEEIEDCVTDDEGKATITFAQEGNYYITAYGTDDTDSQLIMNPLAVSVAPGLSEDEKAAQRVTNQIEAITTVTKENKSTAQAAITAYESLTDAQKAYLSAGTLSKINTIKEALKEIANARPVNTITAANITKEFSTVNKTYSIGAKANGNATLSYSSNNSKITVSQKGVISVPANFIGTATITINAAENDEYKAASKNITLTIVKASQTITTSASKYTKTYGQDPFKLNASAKGKLTYSSSNKKIVTVDSAGKVSIKGAGKATITVTAAETTYYKKATKSVTVTVNKAKQTITATNKKYTVKAKDLQNSSKSFSIGAKAKGKLTYSITDTASKKYLTVTKSGKVTIKKGAKARTYKIKIKAAGTSNYTAASLTVNVYVK